MIGALYGFRKALSPTELPDYRGVFTRRYYVSSHTIKPRRLARLLFLSVFSLLLGLLGELAIEAIDTTVLLDKALLTGVEGVAVGAGINLDFL